MRQGTNSCIYASPTACCVKVRSAAAIVDFADFVAEVESFIDNAVTEALGESPSDTDHSILVDLLVQALEREAAWVDLYGVTGELVVPSFPLPDERLIEPLERAKAV